MFSQLRSRPLLKILFMYVQVTNTPDHIKTYRPKLLVMTGDPRHRFARCYYSEPYPSRFNWYLFIKVCSGRVRKLYYQRHFPPDVRKHCPAKCGGAQRHDRGEGGGAAVAEASQDPRLLHHQPEPGPEGRGEELHDHVGYMLQTQYTQHLPSYLLQVWGNCPLIWYWWVLRTIGRRTLMV